MATGGFLFVEREGEEGQQAEDDEKVHAEDYREGDVEPALTRTDLAHSLQIRWAWLVAGKRLASDKVRNAGTLFTLLIGL